MSKRLLLLLLPALLLIAAGLVWAAVPEGDDPLEPAVTITRTPILTEFGYLPVTFGDEVGPTVTATTPPPTMTPFMLPTGTPGPGTPTVTATSTVAGDGHTDRNSNRSFAERNAYGNCDRITPHPHTGVTRCVCHRQLHSS